MQFRNLLILFLLALAFLPQSQAQDFHYTQYFFSPLGVNPALAGAYNGSYRINGIYRDQYRGVGDPFGGFSLNVDAPIITGFRKQDWVGVGLRLEQDQSGSVGQKMNFYGLGASYHLGLDKNQLNVLTLGAQYGTGGLSYDRLGVDATTDGILTNALSDNATMFNMAQGGGGSDPGDTGVDGGSLNDLSIGVLYNSRNPKTGRDFKLGLAAEGILSPDRGKRGVDKKGLGINAFTSYETVFNIRTSLTSGAYYYLLDDASALNVNSIVNHKLKPGDEFTLHGGLGLRNLRAVLFYVGVTYKGVRVGLGYDFDIGESVDATNNHKSLEIGVSYTGKIYKKPKPKPIIYCPRI